MSATDATANSDARTPMDSAPQDAEFIDGGRDAGSTDAGAMDAGAMDAGAMDAGAMDAGALDAGAMDAGAMDAGAMDAQADVPAVAPGPLQCRQSSECSGPAADCQRSAPGGVCIGCGNDGDCPGAASCFVGSCVVDCDDDTDCNAGFRCLSSGRCGIRSCTMDADCGPYECRGGQCARWRCDGATCPSGFVCSDTICMES